MNISSINSGITGAPISSVASVNVLSRVPDAANISTTLAPVGQTTSNSRTGNLTEKNNPQTVANARNDEADEAQTLAETEELEELEENSFNSDGDEQQQNSSFTEQELATIQKLKARDLEVRNHEQAHQAVGGQYASAPTYEYERGPDGRNYAVSGEVNIQLLSSQGDPQQTIRQADQVIRAALAPAEPSAQDRRVAAQATQTKIDAQQQLREQQQEQITNEDGGEGSERETLGNRDSSDFGDNSVDRRFANFIDTANVFPVVTVGELFSISA